jgi:predicted ArsR family transcriptional regulator
MTAGRPRGEVRVMVFDLLTREELPTRDVRERLQLSNDQARKVVHRLAAEGALQVVEYRTMPPATQPVAVYRAAGQAAYPNNPFQTLEDAWFKR